MYRTARFSRLKACAPTLLAALLGVVVLACGPSGPTLTQDPSGSVLFEDGQQALAEEDWTAAAEAFDTLIKNYPASPHLAEARLGLGAANIAQGRPDTLIIGIDAFQSFLTYHPSHDRVDYAHYMIGIGYMEQIRSADRDQTNTRNAVDAFDDFLAQYPDSDLVPEVRAQRRVALDRLAQHQVQVADWQLRRGFYQAAADRARVALEDYPDSNQACDLNWVLAESLRGLGQEEEASDHYRRIVEEYPDCEMAEEARQRLEGNGD